MLKVTVRTLAMALACLIIGACSRGADHPAPTAGATAKGPTVYSMPTANTSPKELKVYSVPVQQTDAIYHSLQLALGVEASISKAAPGRLLIYASRGTQASIGEAIATMEKNTPTTPSDKAGDQALQVRFWVIDALPGSGSDDPALQVLAPTLVSLKQSMGALHFSLDSSVAAASSLGQHGTIQTSGAGAVGKIFAFNSKAGSNGGVQLHITYLDNAERGLAKLETDLNVPLGHYIVLAQGPGACTTGSLPSGHAAPCDQKSTLRLLVVRVDRIPTAS